MSKKSKAKSQRTPAAPATTVQARFIGINGRSKMVKNAAQDHFNEFMGISSQTAYDFPENDRGYMAAWAASVWAKRCISILANVFMALPTRCIDNRSGDALPNNHPFAQLFDWRTQRLRWITETQYQMFGRAFWRPYFEGRRLYYQVLNPLTVEVLRNRHGVQGFIQRINGAVAGQYAADELVYFYDYDPEDDLAGLPAIAWILRTIGVDISAEQFTKTFFENDATPGGLLTSEQDLQPQDQERLAAQWNKDHKGADKKNRTAVLGKGVNYQVITPAMKDLAQDILDEKTKRRIAAAFGVPPTIALMDDSANFATAKESHIVLYTETAVPNAILRFTTINEEVAPLFGDYRVEVATDQIEVLQEDRVEITNRSTQGFQGGVRSFNESRELEGLPGLNEGDFYLISGRPVAKGEIESGKLTEAQADSTLTYSQIATYTGGVASLNEARKMQDLPPLPIDVFIVPNVGIVTRSDLEAGKLPLAPAAMPGSPFGMPGLGDGSSANLPVDADKAIGLSACVLLSLANNTDLIALQKQLQGMMPDVEWNDPADFHITVCYAPSVSEDQLPAFTDTIKQTPCPAMTLRLGSLHTFDNLGNHAVHFRIRRSSELEDYQEALYNALQAAGFAMSAYSNPESYIPHITMGYAKSKPNSITYQSKLTVTPDKVLATSSPDGDDDNTVLFEAPLAPMVIDQPPQKSLAPNPLRELQVLELKRWRKKVGTKNDANVAFTPEYIGAAQADFIRMDLAAGVEAKEIFSRALKAVEQPDPDLATPEEFEAYWRGIGGLYDAIQRTVLAAWTDLPQKLAAAIRQDEGAANLEPILQAQDEATIAALVGTPDAPGELVKVILAGSARGNDLLEKSSKAAELSIAWDLLNTQAFEWARNFAAQEVALVGQTTRQALQDNVSAWIASGEPLSKLADVIEGTLNTNDMTIPAGFSPEKIKWLTSYERAAQIAQTEVTQAFHQGAQNRWKQAGVTEMRFRTQQDSLVCPICRGLNNTIGVIGQGFNINGQAYQIPVHIGCRCFASAVAEVQA